MKLKINNINKVKEANINLNGITVIAGANGSGKSTVGKLLFSMVKAGCNAEEVKGQSTSKRLKKAVDSLYRRISLSFSRVNDDLIKELFPLPSIRMVERLESISEDKEAINSYLDKLQNTINSMEISPRIKMKFEEDIDNISIAMGNSPAADVAMQVRSFVESEFLGRICSNGKLEASAILEMENPEEKLELHFYKDSVDRVEYHCIDFLSDCTYIESPLYMHILDTLLSATTYKEYQQNKRRIPFNGMVPIHIKDLATKLDAIRIAIPNLFNDTEVDISSIIGGRFEYDKEGHKIVYREEKTGASYSPLNVASGIKSFGLIQDYACLSILGTIHWHFHNF